MKKIVIIAVYFGDLPSNYRLFLKSVEGNPSIDFKIFTDQKLHSSISNLEYLRMDLDKLNKLVKTKLSDDFFVSKPYKCCDYKPVYGILFEDYISEYDFWGHCDLDVVLGDLRTFLTDSILNSYDKILPLGHLSLYRNSKDVNERYMDEGSLVGNYREVFSTDKNCFFDESPGMVQIYYKHHYPFYDKRIFADISTKHKRFVLALGDKNYDNQIFYWEDGHVYRAFEVDGVMNREEFAYIHFQKRKHLKDFVKNGNARSFFICDKGFIEKEVGLPTISEIKKYNRCFGKNYEYLEGKSKRISGRLKREYKKLKDMVLK